MNTDLFVYAYATLAVITGGCIGSFLNVLIARWPYDASLLPRSHCPSCGAKVRPKDLIPVWSWIRLGGRCRDCRSPIALHYPLVELLGAIAGWLVFQRFVSGFEDLTLGTLVAWVAYLGFISALIVMSYVDLRHSIIPDQTSSWAVPFGTLTAIVLEWLGVTGWPIVTWQQSIVGAAVGGGLFALFAVIGHWLTDREALGWGDAKMMAMIGSFVGFVPGVWVILLAASILASVVGILHLIWTRRRSYLPLGPTLGLVTVIYVLYGDVLIPLLLPVESLLEPWP